MEKLFAYAYLWQVDLDNGEKYHSYLDELFINENTNTSFGCLLLDLECLTDSESSIMRIERYVEYETSSFDADAFGKQLFYALKVIYDSDTMQLDLFTHKCYELFNLLSSIIDVQNKPFDTLCYIDDMIQFNREMEIRKQIVKLFDYYNS